MPDTRISDNPYKSEPKGPFRVRSNEVERGMAHDLICLSQHLLSVALRLDGTHPAMCIHAEFQGLDLALAEFNKRLVTYRAVLDK